MQRFHTLFGLGLLVPCLAFLDASDQDVQATPDATPVLDVDGDQSILERFVPLTGVAGLDDAVLRVRVLPVSELANQLPGDLAPSSFGAGAQNGFADASDGNSFCCTTQPGGCPEQPVFQSGDVMSLNYYWSEFLPQDPGTTWPVTLKLALGLPSGDSLLLVDDPAFDFGDLSSIAGSEIAFCVSVQATVPPLPQGYGFVDQIFTVISPQGGFQRLTSGGFTVN